MLKEFIEKIMSLAKVETLTIGNKNFTSKKIFPVKEGEPETLMVTSLDALVDYIMKDVDNISQIKTFIHIVHEQEILLCSYMLGDFNQRFTLMKVEIEPESILTIPNIKAFLVEKLKDKDVPIIG